MQTIVNTQTPYWTEGNITVLSPEAVINSGYVSFCLRTGQFSLQQPWQRSAAPHTQQQGQSPAGSKRHSDGAPKQPIHVEEYQQQLYKDITIILQAHRQLLQLCQQGGPGTSTTAATSRQQGDAESASFASAYAAVANDEALDDAAAASVLPAISASKKDSAAGGTSANWPAVNSLKQVLKPTLSFQCVDHEGQQNWVHSKLFGAVISNNSSSEVVATAYDQQVLLPPLCSFCMSDMKGIQPFIQAVRQQGGADVLLVDPPWENASARRSATYSTLTPNHLLYLPVKDMVRQTSTSLVALWVTNRPRMHRFIRQQLLPAWGLQHVATWFWLKVTDAGEPVTPLSSLHRHPFEQLWLLRPVLQQQEPADVPGSQSVPVHTDVATAAAAPSATPAAVMLAGGSQLSVSVAAVVAVGCLTPAAVTLASALDNESQLLGTAASATGAAGVPVSAVENESLHQQKRVDPRAVGCNQPPVRELPPPAASLHHQQQQQAVPCNTAHMAPTGSAGVDQGSSSALVSAAAAAAQQAHLLLGDPSAASPVLHPPNQHVIVSVPGAHSRKPHLKELLVPYVQQCGCKDLAAVKQATDGNSITSAAATAITGSQATEQAEGVRGQSLQTGKAVAAPGWSRNDELSVAVVSGSTLVPENRVAGKQPPLFVELFARELFPGCMSWGNEVLKFQDLNYWCGVAE